LSGRSRRFSSVLVRPACIVVVVIIVIIVFFVAVLFLEVVL